MIKKLKMLQIFINLGAERSALRMSKQLLKRANSVWQSKKFPKLKHLMNYLKSQLWSSGYAKTR